ncbi:hypothetical protein IRJ41_022813 [Triplophysa rosa]|uniref:Uncharacterized protein n=1 Tax=Triplophysa rosa TaxID=992332 RepID=A0A9W7WZ95_TRIRA|nr:hypothetical protein IRJ41_022813 [Triplophysa rosa]
MRGEGEATERSALKAPGTCGSNEADLIPGQQVLSTLVPRSTADAALDRRYDHFNIRCQESLPQTPLSDFITILWATFPHLTIGQNAKRRWTSIVMEIFCGQPVTQHQHLLSSSVRTMKC